MKRFGLRSIIVIVTSLLLFTNLLTYTSLVISKGQRDLTPAAREDAYRANNIGVALLEQFKYKDAAEAFKRALQIDPKLSIAHINLSIALFNVPDLPGAQREAQISSALATQAPQPYYILGLIAKLQSRPDEALAAFQRVLKTNPDDVGTNINVGQLFAQQRKYPEAIAAFKIALAAEPYNATALYNLGQALMRAGQRAEGQKVTEHFQALRERGSATTIGQNYLEQGRFAEAVASTGAEKDLVDRATPAVAYLDATTSLMPGLASEKSNAAPLSLFSRAFTGSTWTDTSGREIAAAFGGNVTLFDFDGDGTLDVFWASPSEQHLLRNVAGKLIDATAASGALGKPFNGIPIGAVAGDFDNDGKPDLFVIRDGSLSLYHNDGGGRFTDVTEAASIPTYPFIPSAVAFVDVDHDGDLDLFITGLADARQGPRAGAKMVFPDDFPGAPYLLLRNDGNGKFTDITAASHLNTSGHAVGIIPTDFNNRRDMDLLVINYGKAPELYSNQRDGTFRNVSKEAGLDIESHWTCAGAGDVNKDGYTDFVLGRTDGPTLLFLSDGHEKFKTTQLPSDSAGAHSVQLLDYDNDGLLDCLTVSDKGLRVWRNVGGEWIDTSERAITNNLATRLRGVGVSRLFGAGDLDNDGDIDILLPSAAGGITIARNDGGNNNRSLHVNLAGKVSNRSGIGTKIEARAGSLLQKLETSSASPAVAPADILFGLGKRQTADAVRVIWPAGIVQAETEIAVASKDRSNNSGATSFVTLNVTELDRKPSSCPYLYTWNGQRFEFITDFMGGGEMGYLEEPGRHNTPDPVEYVRIREDQLKPRNGRYELRVTNELEEALFADKFQLMVMDHPRDVQIYPNEGMTDPPRPFKLFVTQNARPPLSAVDEHGHDVLSRITEMDRQYPDDFPRDRIRGYAAEHTLSLKLMEPRESNRIKAGSEHVVLLLTGWTDYAWSSDNVAAAQSGKAMVLPALQVKDAKGHWRTVIDDIGIPVGRPQTVTVDLTGKFLSVNREVRIVTNMRILWDQILVDTSGAKAQPRMTRLDPMTADLWWRGFSAEVSPDGREPFGYDYDQVSFTSPWKVMSGRYTREGGVRELVLQSDDMFVIARPGDEISLSFDAGGLPGLPAGWTRTFLLYADGFSKEMDINSASPDQIAPLPFHGMTRYPYAYPEAFPITAARRAYIDKYNTRVVTAEIPSIDTLLNPSFAH